MKKETYEVKLALISSLSFIGGYWIIIDQLGLMVALGILLIIGSLTTELKRREIEKDKRKNIEY